MKRLLPAVVAAALLALTGCGGKKRARVVLPPPPPPATTTTAPPVAEQPRVRPPSGKVVFTEEGYASWYGTVFHHRRAANGDFYDENAMTAAHRTLPLNSVVRVTNLKTDQSVVVRITDRGPFVPNRIIDLSVAAAKAIGVWRPGTALVRLDVLQAPAPIQTGGRWCVQIGAIDDEATARELQDKLARRYQNARVLAFSGPTHDWWVRVRFPDGSKQRAEEVVQHNETPEGHFYMVRLD